MSDVFAAEMAEEHEKLDLDQPILVFDDVSLSFAGVKALAEVSFEVGPRDLFAIIGPNGAGKTSTFNVMSGIYRPQQGASCSSASRSSAASPTTSPGWGCPAPSRTSSCSPT